MASIESISENLSEAVRILERAAADIGKARLAPTGKNFAAIGSALAGISAIQDRIYHQRPDLRPTVPERQPDPNLNKEQQAKVQALSSGAVRKIDELLLAHVAFEWRKVASVVGSSMTDENFNFESIPDIYLAQRVIKLVETEKLESQGNLQFMRYSEIRLTK